MKGREQDGPFGPSLWAARWWGGKIIFIVKNYNKKNVEMSLTSVVGLLFLAF
jgi:hypothetical protein